MVIIGKEAWQSPSKNIHPSQKAGKKCLQSKPPHGPWTTQEDALIHQKITKTIIIYNCILLATPSKAISILNFH
jgi:hypothetical protein